MKIKIGPYLNYFSVYNITEFLTDFGMSEETADKLGDWLDDTWLGSFFKWIYSKRKRTIKVKIHDYDVWNMYDTLSFLIYPMLVKLKDDKVSYAIVDNEDVPEDMHTVGQLGEKGASPDPMWEAKWEYVLNEMIFAFKAVSDITLNNIDWVEKYYTGDWDMQSKETIIDGETLYEMVPGPNHTYKADMEGIKKEQARITNGFRLFGKYYQSLWS